MAYCLYCSGDTEGFVCNIPKIGKGNGNAIVDKSPWGSKLIVSLPFGKKLEYEIAYCPMCGEKLNNYKKLEV